MDEGDKVEKMIERVRKETGHRLEFTILMDPGHRVIDRYGLLNSKGRGWPHPTVYVIDKQGTVRWKFTEVNYKVRPTNEMILEALREVSGKR